MPKSPLPSIVLVHGAFSDGSSWDRVVSILLLRGYPVVAVHQPLTSFAADVAATERAIEAQPGDVLLVGHAYGGAVITEAGNAAKVKGLVYVAAFAPDTDESINDLGKGRPAPAWLKAVRVDASGFGWLPSASIANDVAHDLSASESKLLSAKQGPICMQNFDAKIRAAAWHKKPVWYLRASQDHMIDPGEQVLMAQRMQATLVSVSTSHVPMLSQPKEVASVLQTAAASLQHAGEG